MHNTTNNVVPHCLFVLLYHQISWWHCSLEIIWYRWQSNDRCEWQFVLSHCWELQNLHFYSWTLLLTLVNLEKSSLCHKQYINVWWVCNDFHMCTGEALIPSTWGFIVCIHILLRYKKAANWSLAYDASLGWAQGNSSRQFRIHILAAAAAFLSNDACLCLDRSEAFLRVRSEGSKDEYRSGLGWIWDIGLMPNLAHSCWVPESAKHS